MLSALMTAWDRFFFAGRVPGSNELLAQLPVFFEGLAQLIGQKHVIGLGLRSREFSLPAC
jgi:hypothetical protein